MLSILIPTYNYNEKINSLKNSKFIAQKQNAGYRGNRNNLVKKSKYEYLLFIDGDSIINNKNFLFNYISNLDNYVDIIYGGRTRPINIDDANKKLRWKYGKQIEDKTAMVRNKNIYKSLMFNNTLIRKECFNSIKFDTSVTKFGWLVTITRNKFVKILNFYTNLKKIKINYFVSFLFKFTKPVLTKQLESSNPSLILFNFYKIGLLCSLKK